MAYRVVFAPEARAQILAIYGYSADAANPEIALAFTEAIIDHCEGFTTFPHRGTRRDDLRPGLRLIGFRKRATIAFGIDGQTITIIGVFYGGQDVEDALRSDVDK